MAMTPTQREKPLKIKSIACGLFIVCLAPLACAQKSRPVLDTKIDTKTETQISASSPTTSDTKGENKPNPNPKDNNISPNRSNSMGINLAGIADWATELPFVDLMKQSRKWQDFKRKVEGFDVDENDWIKSLKPGQTAGTVFLAIKDPAALPFKRVIVFYEGEGKLQYGWGAKLISNESSKGRDAVEISPSVNLLSIVQTNPKNPIRNIRIIPEPYLDYFKKGLVFNPDWLKYVAQFRALRFMNWMGINGSTQSKWQDRPLPEHRTWRNKGGAPIEIMLQLSNMLNTDPWLSIPHLADENYMFQFAKLVEKNLDPTLTLYIEHSNEVWNFGFKQTRYANKTGRTRWGEIGNAFMQWHGMRTAQVCDAFKLKAFAGQTDRVKCVLGVHTGWHGLAKGALECPEWVAEGNKACHEHGIDYLAITSYFNGGLNGPNRKKQDPAHEPTLRNWLKEKDGGLNKAFAQLSNGNQLRKLERYKDFHGAAKGVREQLDYWAPYAKKYDMGVLAYEGGQHITTNGLALSKDKEFANFHISINRDPRMQPIYTEVMQAWKDGGGELHMHFTDVGSPSKYGSWGALEHLNQGDSPRWRAISDFNTKVKCWWLDCAN
jgi:hypothetical protein